MFNKSISVVLILTLLVSPLSLFGQVIPTPEDQFAVQINVLDIKVATTTLNAGETIMGEVVVNNAYINDVSDLTLSLFVVNNLDGLSFGRVFNTSLSDSFNLKKGEFKTIPFSINIPEAGDSHNNGLAIDVINKSGDILGSNTLPITIKGFKPFVLISGLYLLVGEEDSFLLQEGPTVKPGDVATFNATINASSSIVATPHIRIYDFDTTNTLLKEYKLPSVEVLKDTPQSFSFDLETLEYRPGVYEGSVVMENDAGQPVSDIIEFRYVVWGEMATLRNISSDKYFGKKGEMVNVSVEAYGAPYNLLENKAPVMGDLSLELSLFNSKGKQVGSANEKINFDENPTAPFLENISVKLIGDANTFLLKASIKNSNGKVLAYREINLSGDQIGDVEKNINLFVVFGIVLALLAVIVLALLKKRALIVVIIALGFFMSSSSVSATGTVTPGVVVPGQAYTVTETCTYNICRNANGSIKASVDQYSAVGYYGVYYCPTKKNKNHRCEDSPSRTVSKAVTFTSGAPGIYYHRVMCEVYQGGDTGYSQLENRLVSVRVECPADKPSWNGSACVDPTPLPGTCGSATSTPSFNFPSSNLCATGNEVSNQVTSTTKDPHTWTCSGLGSTVSCQTDRCSSGQRYCSTTNSCIANSSCCGAGPGGACMISLGESCVQTGGFGSCSITDYCTNISGTQSSLPAGLQRDSGTGSCSCVNGGDNPPTCTTPLSVCSYVNIGYTLNPSIVADPSQQCTFSWGAISGSTGSDTSGASCDQTVLSSCSLDGNTVATSSSRGVFPGVHTLTCTDSNNNTKSVTALCKVNPDYGEF